MTEISTRSNFEIDTIEVDADHIHLVSYAAHLDQPDCASVER